MLANRLQRWPNIETALGECLVFAETLSHHLQEVLLAQFSLYVHKGGLKPDSFHFFAETLVLILYVHAHDYMIT